VGPSKNMGEGMAHPGPPLRISTGYGSLHRLELTRREL